MTYQQYLSVLIDNRLFDHNDYNSYSNYETALNTYNNDIEAQEQYSTCLDWFNDYVAYEKINGL